MARADLYYVHSAHRDHHPSPGVGWLIMFILALVMITAVMFFGSVGAIMSNSILGMSSDVNQTIARNQSLYDSAESTRTGSVTKEDER